MEKLFRRVDLAVQLVTCNISFSLGASIDSFRLNIAAVAGAISDSGPPNVEAECARDAGSIPREKNGPRIVHVRLE